MPAPGVVSEGVIWGGGNEDARPQRMVDLHRGPLWEFCSQTVAVGTAVVRAKNIPAETGAAENG